MADPTTATVVVVAGSVVFLIGASMGVPRVFTEPDADERLRLLEAPAGAAGGRRSRCTLPAR